MSLPAWVRVYRFLFGVLAIYAVLKNYSTSDVPDRFFRFFTNQSNLIAGVVLILGATVFAHRYPPLAWGYVRGSAVMMMITTGAVYALLLGGLYNPFGDAYPWTDSVLHQLMPIVMVVEVLLVPLNRRIKGSAVIIFALYPLLYLAYSLYYGANTGWYPYDFLNPQENGGYRGVLTTVGLLLAGFFAISALILKSSGWARQIHIRRRYPDPPVQLIASPRE